MKVVIKASRWFSCILALFIALFIVSNHASAATITVTANATDTLDGGDGQCSLREAITNINDGVTTFADCAPVGAYGTDDTISIPAGTYTTLIAGTGEDLNATGDYDILKSVVLVGAGAATTIIDGAGKDRVFDINENSYLEVSISGVTIKGGAATTDVGGGIYNRTGLTVTNSTISDNSADNEGGGIFNAYLLTITNSTISGNSSATSGGGIYNQASNLYVTNSTISGNSAVNGGGIYYNNFRRACKITNSTISGNSATSSGGGIYIQIGSPTVSNTIIANHTTGADCAGTIITAGHNLESGTSCGFTGTGDVQNSNPLLGALANNGGTTKTLALLTGSPAVNAGDDAICAAAPVNGVDQRGIARPQGGICDIGAFELGNGTCGTSNGAPFTITPASNLCATGTASAVNGTGPWSWTCTAATATSCWAYRQGTVLIPKTGQTLCYDTIGTAIACAGTGQDGDKQAGAAQTDPLFTDGGTTITDKVYGMVWRINAGYGGLVQTGIVGVPATRFTDNLDGTMTDNLTGLVWLKDAGCFATVGGITKGTNAATSYLTWANALTWSNNLKSGDCLLSDGSLAGDWRLPNLNELTSVATNYDISGDVDTWLNAQGFTDVQSNYYWSSTNNVSAQLAWNVNMLNAASIAYSKGNSSYVWPVRAGQSGSLGSLAISKTGTGTGNVTANSGTITWNGSAGTASYASGTSVILTATATTGSFAGWTGCDSTNANQCTVAATGAKSVAATFNTASVTAPTATTGSASSISTTTATLNGTVTSNGASTTATFNYGTTTGYGSTATAAQSPLALDASDSAVSAAITSLTCNTLYHFRVVGVNSAGTTNGSDASFTTSACASGGSNTYTWTATGATTANYVYRTNPDGSVVSLGSIPIATSSYTDTSALSNTIYTYCIKADDGGSCLQATTIRTPLYNGWNIIGVPYDTTGIAVASLFSSATSTAYEWVSSSSTNPDNSGSYITLSTLTPGKGYFIKAGNSSTMLAYTGAANAATVDVTLKPGWTLISNPYTTNKTGIGTSWLISGLGTLDAAVSAVKIGGDVYWWSGNTYISWKITDLTIPANSAVIEPWKAYWILNMDTIDHTLTMN